MTKELQASTSGGARGGARRAEKMFLEIAPPTPYLRIWMTAFPPSPYLNVCILHCGATIGVGFREVSVRR